MQADVGGVHGRSVQNWERGVTEPAIRYLPAIIEFLGYDPTPEPSGLAARIVYARRRLGWTQEELASTLQVDTVTVYQWEKGVSAPPSGKWTSFKGSLEIVFGSWKAQCKHHLERAC